MHWAADGFIYVVSQAHLYKIEPDSMSIEASIDLPSDRTTVYNKIKLHGLRRD